MAPLPRRAAQPGALSYTATSRSRRQRLRVRTRRTLRRLGPSRLTCMAVPSMPSEGRLTRPAIPRLDAHLHGRSGRPSPGRPGRRPPVHSSCTRLRGYRRRFPSSIVAHPLHRVLPNNLAATAWASFRRLRWRSVAPHPRPRRRAPAPEHPSILVDRVWTLQLRRDQLPTRNRPRTLATIDVQR